MRADPAVDVEAFLRSAVLGEMPAWPNDASQSWQEELWKAGLYHGVLPMLWERSRLASGIDWLAAFRNRLDALVRADAAFELARRAELIRVLDLLRRRGIQPVLLKGGALAYWLYPAPFLRPRADTDLLVPEAERLTVAGALQSEGYLQPNQISSGLVSTQSTFRRVDSAGTVHSLDVHWRGSNSPLLAAATDHAMALSRAIPVPGLGPDAYGMRAVDALLYACVHRASHAHAPFFVDGDAYHGGNRLIWVYDIHLLSGALSQADWGEFVSLAERHRTRAICRDGLEAAREAFGTVPPATAIAGLATSGGAEPSEVLLSGSRRSVMWQELKVLSSWSLRARFVREHLLPEPGYVLRKYDKTSRWWLPWLYIKRAAGGCMQLSR